MKTWHIHIQGQVQGVGFRPFIYRLAHDLGLKGWVNNTLDGVHIRVNADGAAIRTFCQAIESQAPPLARLLHLRCRAVTAEPFSDFRIVHSDSSGAPDLLLTPDVALCADCRAEIHNPDDRRADYAFTTCINCGPRYSILRSVPYDRPNTSMAPFEMCLPCQREYDDPADRRYYAQTNSCADCGIQMELWAKGERLGLSQDEVLHGVVDRWAAGQIIAIKGIGGYLLTCDARNTAAVQRLRTRKRRPSKPFALMLPSLKHLRQVAAVSQAAADALTGPVAPIVLLPLKDDARGAIAKEAIAPGLGQVGAMLPYTPLYELLLSRYGHPVVATSGNLSQSPIVYKDEVAQQSLHDIADALLLHNRPIETPQDDSVLAFTPYHRRPVWMRRSRGLAPGFWVPDIPWPKATILAAGASLKSAFALLHQGKVFISQYLGDLEQWEAQRHYQATYQHLSRTLSANPELVLVDAHPDYASTHFARELQERTDLALESVQHHKAHFGAIVGEHGLWGSQEPVLGFIWDGTGLGEDGQIWGGETFLYRGGRMERMAHFEYFPSILGDKMPKEPRIAALSATYGLPSADQRLRPLFTDTEWRVYQQLLAQPQPLFTSSVGRLFDAVAALTGLCSKQAYEGEAAIKLEQEARKHLKNESLPDAYHFNWEAGQPLPVQALLAQILEEAAGGHPAGYIAARFHHTLAQIVARVSAVTGVRQLAFSGGVFQNGLLVDLITDALPVDCLPHFHERLSPNDENIAFGQLICHLIGQRHSGH